MPLAAAPGALRQLLMSFESLGENCEFARVQRRAKAEPLGLLRWAGVPLAGLMEFLAGGHAVFATRESLALNPPARPTPRPEFMLLETATRFLFHTNRLVGSVDPAALLAQEAQRLRFLRDKLLDDLRSAEKIFVFKPVAPRAPAEIAALLAALRRHGPARLLWVIEQDDDLPATEARRLAPGFAQGAVAKFAPIERSDQFDEQVWFAMLRRAHDLLGG